MSNPDLRRAFAVGEAKRVWKLYGFQTPADLVLEDLAMAMGVVGILHFPSQSSWNWRERTGQNCWNDAQAEQEDDHGGDQNS